MDDSIGDWGSNATCWSETTFVASAPMPPPGMMPQQQPQQPMGPPPMAQPVRAVEDMQAPLPPMPYYGAPMPPPQPVRAVNGLGDVESVKLRHTLGLSLVLVPAVGAVGLYYGGPFGGVAGIFMGGAAVNAYRAARSVTQGSPEGDREAMISGTYAVLGLAVGGYLAWRIYEQKHHKPATRSPVGA